MMRTLLLLSLLAGVALAEEEVQEEGKTIVETVSAIALIKAVINVAIQIVVMIALILLISTLKKTTGDPFALFGKYEPDYDYYYVPAHDTSGSSSYSGYSKRSVDTPSSFMDLPIVQRLTEQVQNAIENFEY